MLDTVLNVPYNVLIDNRQGGEEVRKEKNVYEEERELLHKQLKLLAEQSVGCLPHDLAELSEQMVAIYSVLNPCEQRCSCIS